VFVSGDQAVVTEMQDLVPNVRYVVTKWAFGPYALKSRSVSKSEELIRLGCWDALRSVSGIEPFRLDPPYRIVEGDDVFEGDDLIGVFSRFTDPSGTWWRNQDINPERSVAKGRRQALCESDTAYNPFNRKRS
jgi:hypothetical protein